jgi:hypothetical protein
MGRPCVAAWQADLSVIPKCNLTLRNRVVADGYVGFQLDAVQERAGVLIICQGAYSKGRITRLKQRDDALHSFRAYRSCLNLNVLMK